MVLALPPVQTFIAKKAAAIIAENTGARISVGKVAINLPDNVRLSGIYLEDIKHDTVLYAGRLQADISLFELLRQKIIIEKALLKDAVVNVSRDAGNHRFNFQHLIDAFASGKQTQNDITASPWIFSVNSVELENVRAHIDLPGVKIKGAIGSFSANAAEFDIKAKIMDYEHVRLKNSDMAIVLPQRDTSAVKAMDTSSAKLIYIMPDIGWVIRAREIIFNGNAISFDDNSKKPQPHGVDYLHLGVAGMNVLITDAFYAGHVLKADIGNISLNEKSGAHLRQLSGSFLIDETSIRLEKLSAELNDSRIEMRSPAVLKFQDLAALSQLSEEVSIDVSLNKSHISPADLLLFVPQLGEIKSLSLRSAKSIYIDGAIAGTVGNLSSKNFICSLGNHATLQLDFHAAGLPDVDKTVFNLNISDFSTAPDFISSFIQTGLPEEIQRLGKISLKGKYTGTIRDMRFDGVILTQAGVISPNLHTVFNDDYTSASYDGSIGLEKFQLGEILGDTAVGAVSLQASIAGAGMSAENLTADIKAEIKEAAYNKYTYQNIMVEGSLDRKMITATANVNDENLKLHFTGVIDLSDSVPSFSFDAALDTTNIGALRFTSGNFFIGADIAGNFSARSLDNFSGSVSLKKFHFGNDSLRCPVDSLVLSASAEGSDKTMKIESPVINATLTGDFNIAHLPDLLIDYLNNYFPVGEKAQNSASPSGQKFKLLASASKPLEAVRVFLPQISQWDTASLSGSFDSQSKTFELNADIPGITYDSLVIGSVSIRSAGNKDTLNFSASINDVNYSNEMQIRKALLKASASGKIIRLDVAIDSDSIRRLGLAADITKQPDNIYKVHVQDNLIINNEKWTVHAGNYTNIRSGFLHVNALEISEREQKISIFSPQSSFGIINIVFTDFDLREVSDLAGFIEMDIDGAINGTLSLNDLFNHPSFTADLSVNDIAMNSNSIGDLSLKAIQQGEDIEVNVALKGGENNLVVAGKIIPKSGTMNLDVNMRRLNLSAADPFLRDFISDSKGYFTANLKAEGEFAKPAINGNISLHGISTHAVYPNARYALADNSIEVSSQRISVNGLQVFDEQNRKVTLEGFLAHDNFTDLHFDLRLNSDEFLFMNTEKNDDFLYGTVLLGVNAHLTGNPELPVVEAEVVTKPGTRVFVLPMSQQQSIKQEDFVLFQSPPYDAADADSAVEAAMQYKARVTGIDLRLAFQLTPDAELQIIVDPYAGDKLTCKGTANLSVYIPPSGTLQVDGSFLVESGDYSFSYQRMLKRQFSIRQGSRIDFSGDVMDALLDISAVYTAKASTYELIAAESASLNASEISAAKKRVPVDVILNIRGDIAQPELTYDVRIGESTGNVTGSAAERKLMQLRQNQAELSKQVFALLLFNSFVADYNTGGTDWGTAGANMALQSVSSMLTNQLNKLSSRAEGFEINLDLTSYQDEFASGTGSDNVTEMGFDISKQFLNERLEVSVGGNVNLDNSASGQSGDVSNITGDFTIEYKLTESGKYRVKVFRTGNYDMVNQSNIYRMGVGLSYRHSFKSVLPRRREGRKQDIAQ